jgi:glycosyltransferase involved in cell wall biosynthesis
MNILLINHYAGSPNHGMEYRPFYFAREWVRAGHRVLVVAASFSHLRQVNPALGHATLRETHEGVEYLWVKTPAYQGNGLGRVRNMATFMGRLSLQCRGAIAAFAPDAVIASSTYTWDNWVAAHYARRLGARYAYELHDLWPLSPMELGGMSARNPFIWSLQRAEDFACRRADTIVSLLPEAKAHLVEHGMRPDKFVYVPNGIVLEEWEGDARVPASHAETLREIRRALPFVVGYVGGHGLSNALDVLVEAGADARLGGVGIVCVGGGAEKARLEQKARALGSHVHFLPPVPKNEVAGLLGLFDALYIGWARSPLYRFGISPNKLFEYMMAGVPIVHAVDAANDPVREAGCGLSVAPDDVGAAVQGLLELASLSPEERRQMGMNGRRYVELHHDISTLARVFLDSVAPPADDKRDMVPAEGESRGVAHG